MSVLCLDSIPRTAWSWFSLPGPSPSLVAVVVVVVVVVAVVLLLLLLLRRNRIPLWGFPLPLLARHCARVELALRTIATLC